MNPMSQRWSGSLVLSLCVLLALLYAKDTNAAAVRQSNGPTTVAAGLNQTANATVKPEVCEDKNKMCSFWSKFGYCYNGYYKGYMGKVCKKSCNFCGHMTGKCRDKSFYCPSWTSYYPLLCKLDFYKTACPYSCGVCKT